MKEKQISEMTSDEARQRRLEIKDELKNHDLRSGRKRRLEGQLDKIEKIHGITRRQFLKIGGIATLLGLGGAGLAIVASRDDGKNKVERSQSVRRPKPTPVPSTPSRQPDGTAIEVNIDRKIEAIEAGFLRFGEKVLPLIKNINDPYIRKLIKMAFDLVAHNAKVNKERNVRTLARNRGHGTNNYYINVYTSQFFYEFKKMPFYRTAASFSPSKRKMTLSKRFDPNSVVNNLVLFHEMIHVYYDSKARSKLKSKEEWRTYHAFFKYEKDGGVPRLNIIDEATALACELEVLNLLLDGELEKTVRSGGRSDVRGIREKLKAKDFSQIGPLNFIIKASRPYFQGTRKYLLYTKAFLDFIASAARKRGYKVVISNGIGSISPYR